MQLIEAFARIVAQTSVQSVFQEEQNTPLNVVSKSPLFYRSLPLQGNWFRMDHGGPIRMAEGGRGVAGTECRGNLRKAHSVLFVFYT